MAGAALPIPGILLGTYPQRPREADDWAVRLGTQVAAVVERITNARGARARRFVGAVRSCEARIACLGEAAATARLTELRALLARDGLGDALLSEAFAFVLRACERALGKTPYDTQLMAARIMLGGGLAEMATGEGKTLTAGVCAVSAALAGIPVHVVTVNDYLVARDAALLRPLAAALGLSVGAVTQPLDVAARTAAYACDITYCTAKELAFDYLRDGVACGHQRADLRLRAVRIGGVAAGPAPLLRGLCMALIDEADSVLLDEARVPLILSQASNNPAQAAMHATALGVAGALAAGRDFALDARAMTGRLTPAGCARAERLCEGRGGLWRNRLHREEAVGSALAALHLYRRDRHYLVADGKILIIDEATGRLAAGRVWSNGLHQLIERKEGVKPTPELVTAAQITFQRFFQRYLRIGGMSGTLAEARGELAAVYGMAVVRVPLRRPSRRSLLPTRLFGQRDTRDRALVARVEDLAGAGRPVLIGVDSVADSESLSARLDAAGIAHAVLNARHDAFEADIVARAGAPGQVTVATNMAGRGTDIPLGPGVAERGGLHLISCQHNAARRIDRQLIGRCARQGDPGSAETYLALDRPRIGRLIPRWFRAAIGEHCMTRPAWLVALIVLAPQWLAERRERAQRWDMLGQDRRREASASIGVAAE